MTNLQESKILCLGSAGFIGSHLIDELLTQGVPPENIMIMDDLSIQNGVIPEWTKTQPVKKVLGEEGDCSRGWNTCNELAKFKPDLIYNLAVMPLPHSLVYPHANFYINTQIVANILEEIRFNHINCRLVSFSSSEVYGTMEDHVLTEDAPKHPTTPYAASKLAGDVLVESYVETFGIDAVIVRPFNCYDEMTQILTPEGWKYFNELEKEEKVATLNKTTGKLEYQTPTHYTEEQFDGQMVRIRGSQLDAMVTPNHRMWIKRRWKPNYEILEARKLLEYNNMRALVFRMSADWDIKWTRTTAEKTYNYEDETWVKFMAWYLSEGSVDRESNGNKIQIRQTVDEEKKREIFNIVKELGYNPIMLNGIEGRITWSDKKLAHYLRKFGKQRERYVPDEIKNAPRELIRIFIETYMKGDGHVGYSKGYKACESLTSYSDKMLDDLQEIVLKAGWASTKRFPYVFVAKIRTEVCPRATHNFEQEEYKGTVFCVTVPNEIIYIRRNGKAMFCGNTIGPRQNSGTYAAVIPETIRRIREGEKPYITWDGLQRRDIIAVEDAVKGTILAAEKGKKGRTYNLCKGYGVSIEYIVTTIAEFMGYTGEILREPKRPGDVRQHIGDNTRAREELGWEPKVKMREALERIVNE